jgi:hypothetical protein
MSSQCVHVDIDLNVSTDEWLRHCEGVVDTMRALPGLEWKLWLADAVGRTAGGLYLFRDAASAHAYVSGPVIARLRTSPLVQALRLRIYPVADELSRRTGALGPLVSAAEGNDAAR